MAATCVVNDLGDSENRTDGATFGAAGVSAITRSLKRLYPDQPNHLQATALVKFWLGGPDPIDYISILHNDGDPRLAIPPHWHYVSFGFSDLHGDGRVHEYQGQNEKSGFGFELTFRLKKENQEEKAPMWPTTLLNSVARYVFKTGNILNVGDHIPWNQPLDRKSQTQIQHMLVTEDCQMPSLHTPYGHLDFRQILGVTESEMKAAQQWKGSGLIELLRTVPSTGGRYCVTDIKRQLSIFDLDPKYQKNVTERIERDGSNLGHVTSACLWENDDESKENNVNVINQEQPSSQHDAQPGDGDEDEVDEEEEQILNAVHLRFDFDAAKLLPLVFRGRLMKGRYFVYQNVAGQMIIFVPPEFTSDMVLVNPAHPLKALGNTLQIFCSREFTAQVAKEVDILQAPDQLRVAPPLKLKFTQPDVSISVVPTGQLTI